MVSEKPWSDYIKADYTPEQWHTACLLHLHTGPPTSKDQCKLPVKTPSGALNRNGVHAAAAALNGARGGVDASPVKIATARAAVRRLYNQLDEDPPDSMKQSTDNVDDFLEHYGVKGMKWGVRREGSSRPSLKRTVEQAKNKARTELKERTDTETHVRAKPGRHVQVVGGKKKTPHEDAIKARVAEQIAKRNTLDALSNKELQHLVNRMNLESQYRNLAINETRKTAVEKWVEKTLSTKLDKSLEFMGPQAAIGKAVVEGMFKNTVGLSNKAMSGGKIKKDKK